MKRILFSVAIAAALGAGSFAGFRALNPAERQLSDIELANIEALADPDEGEGGGSSDEWDCWSGYTRGDGGAWICGNPCAFKDQAIGSGHTSRCHK